jgi:hypothetical protein
MAKLSPRGARIKAAGIALYGERWQSAMARSIGISKQLLSFVVTGDRQVTDDVEDRVVAALGREIERLGKTAAKLEEIQGRILAASLDGVRHPAGVVAGGVLLDLGLELDRLHVDLSSGPGWPF